MQCIFWSFERKKKKQQVRDKATFEFKVTWFRMLLKIILYFLEVFGIRKK